MHYSSNQNLQIIAAVDKLSSLISSKKSIQNRVFFKIVKGDDNLDEDSLQDEPSLSINYENNSLDSLSQLEDEKGLQFELRSDIDDLISVDQSARRSEPWLDFEDELQSRSESQIGGGMKSKDSSPKRDSEVEDFHQQAIQDLKTMYQQRIKNLEKRLTNKYETKIQNLEEHLQVLMSPVVTRDNRLLRGSLNLRNTSLTSNNIPSTRERSQTSLALPILEQKSKTGRRESFGNKMQSYFAQRMTDTPRVGFVVNELNDSFEDLNSSFEADKKRETTTKGFLILVRAIVSSSKQKKTQRVFSELKNLAMFKELQEVKKQKKLKDVNQGLTALAASIKKKKIKNFNYLMSQFKKETITRRALLFNKLKGAKILKYILRRVFAERCRGFYEKTRLPDPMVLREDYSFVDDFESQQEMSRILDQMTPQKKTLIDFGVQVSNNQEQNPSKVSIPPKTQTIETKILAKNEQQPSKQYTNTGTNTQVGYDKLDKCLNTSVKVILVAKLLDKETQVDIEEENGMVTRIDDNSTTLTENDSPIIPPILISAPLLIEKSSQISIKSPDLNTTASATKDIERSLNYVNNIRSVTTESQTDHDSPSQKGNKTVATQSESISPDVISKSVQSDQLLVAPITLKEHTYLTFSRSEHLKDNKSLEESSQFQDWAEDIVQGSLLHSSAGIAQNIQLKVRSSLKYGGAWDQPIKIYSVDIEEVSKYEDTEVESVACQAAQSVPIIKSDEKETITMDLCPISKGLLLLGGLESKNFLKMKSLLLTGLKLVGRQHQQSKLNAILGLEARRVARLGLKFSKKRVFDRFKVLLLLKRLENSEVDLSSLLSKIFDRLENSITKKSYLKLKSHKNQIRNLHFKTQKFVLTTGAIIQKRRKSSIIRTFGLLFLSAERSCLIKNQVNLGVIKFQKIIKSRIKNSLTLGLRALIVTSSIQRVSEHRQSQNKAINKKLVFSQNQVKNLNKERRNTKIQFAMYKMNGVFDKKVSDIYEKVFTDLKSTNVCYSKVENMVCIIDKNKKEVEGDVFTSLREVAGDRARKRIEGPINGVQFEKKVLKRIKMCKNIKKLVNRVERSCKRKPFKAVYFEHML